MSSQDIPYENEVREAIQRLLATGTKDFPDVLKALGGADPKLVYELLNELGTQPADRSISSIDPFRARRLTAALPLKLPAPNPMASQWWFTLDTVSFLSQQVWGYAGHQPAAFLGVPTVAYHYAHCYNAPTTFLDIDPDVLRAMDMPACGSKQVYDAFCAVPENVAGRHSVVLIDAPWYNPEISIFIARARALLLHQGFILSVLPSRLTRPGIVADRSELLAQLLAAHFEIAALDSDCVEYTVPDFEAYAYSAIPEFAGKPWRRGDLLVLRVLAESNFPIVEVSSATTEIYSRNPARRRFFLSPDRVSAEIPSFVEPVASFESTVSMRTPSIETVAVWGSNKKGVRINDAGLARRILEQWQAGKTISETLSALEPASPLDEEGVRAFADALCLWMNDDESTRRRGPKELENQGRSILSCIAAHPTKRQHDFEGDGFRVPFQRDRDRVLWSHALRRLANKTQLFPVRNDDHLRRRLAHTIEVMQLATTIAAAFGLDPQLTEAGALAHDLGHAPFGHAGEHALDAVLNEINPQLNGFNHYEHGVDVVRWLEDVYQSPGAGGFPGLNLTFEVVECIFKHTYFQGEEKWGQRWLASKTKHADLGKDVTCHMEGQAVRIADKVSYFVSDLEDGIRNGIIDLPALMQCKFFHRPPIDMQPSPHESLYERFISQRRAILKVVMEDILTATDRKIARFSSLQDLRRDPSYAVVHSDGLAGDLSEVWRNLQVGILHKDAGVVSANNRAAKVVSDLLLVYAVAPHLVEERFRRMHTRLHDSEYLKWYITRVGPNVALSKRRVSTIAYEYAIGGQLQSQGDNWSIPTKDLIQAKDYVASLTDTRALSEHRAHCGTLWDSGG